MENCGDAAAFGYVFRNPALLALALTTPSYKMTSPGADDNQRLEFLGDAVLGLLSADKLCRLFPADGEGVLTGMRQQIVSASALCKAVAGTGFAARLRRNKGAEPLPKDAKTVADAVEAVIGAAWLDGGLEAASKVFEGLAIPLPDAKNSFNPKCALQERAQAMHPPRVPVYKVLQTRGTSDKPVFTVSVSVEGAGSAKAEAGSIKEAEKRAASKLISEFFPLF